MLLIHKDNRKRIIKAKEEIKFSSSSGYHLIFLTGRAKSEKQISESSTDDEELTVQIDDKIFPKLGSDSKKVLDSPASINGGKSHNLLKTVYFLTPLSDKDHRIVLKTDKLPNTATFESLEIYSLDSLDTLTLEPKIQAEDGDRREWITFVLDNLPLQEVSITITYSRRKRDSDDIKIKIDGQTQNNLLRDIKHFLWYFVGSLIPLISKTKSESQTFTANLPSDLHYIELDADRMPTLDRITLNFSSLSTKRIPTFDDPKWTGDFADDSDQIILTRAIFGEARSNKLPDEARIAVGWSIRNRVEDPRWPDTYQKVITQDQQYSAFNETDPNRKYVENPFWAESDIDRKAWYNCYDIAGKVINGELKDPANGANHYYDSSISTPYWATKETLVLTINDLDNKPILFFHKL